MPILIERRAYEFTIDSSDEGDESQEFLALQCLGRPEFILYWLNDESGDYEYATGPVPKEKTTSTAIDYMVEQWSYEREKLSARIVG